MPLIDGMESMPNFEEVIELDIGLAIAISIFPTSIPFKIRYKSFLNGQVSWVYRTVFSFLSTGYF